MFSYCSFLLGCMNPPIHVKSRIQPIIHVEFRSRIFWLSPLWLPPFQHNSHHFHSGILTSVFWLIKSVRLWLHVWVLSILCHTDWRVHSGEKPHKWKLAQCTSFLSRVESSILFLFFSFSFFFAFAFGHFPVTLNSYYILSRVYTFYSRRFNLIKVTVPISEMNHSSFIYHYRKHPYYKTTPLKLCYSNRCSA